LRNARTDRQKKTRGRKIGVVSPLSPRVLFIAQMCVSAATLALSALAPSAGNSPSLKSPAYCEIPQRKQSAVRLDAYTARLFFPLQSQAFEAPRLLWKSATIRTLFHSNKEITTSGSGLSFWFNR
jgi:hypothetical protein